MTERDTFARTFRRSRREAVLVMVVWALALVWAVGFCYLRGYEHPPDSWVVQAGLAVARTPANYQHLWGLPDWVVLGILLPWLLSSAFTAGFCVGMTDDDLGPEAAEGEATDGH
jgi:hypothetical protein